MDFLKQCRHFLYCIHFLSLLISDSASVDDNFCTEKEYRAIVMNLEAFRAQLKQKTRDQSEVISTLMAALTEMQARFDQLESKTHALDSRMTSYEHSLEKTTDHLESVDVSLNTTITRLEFVETSLLNLSSRYENSTDEIKQRLVQVENLTTNTSRIESIEAKLETIANDNSSLNHIQNIEVSLNSTSVQLNSVAALVDKANERLDVAESALSYTTIQQEFINISISNFQEHLDLIGSSVNTTNEQLKRNNKMMNATNEQLTMVQISLNETQLSMNGVEVFINHTNVRILTTEESILTVIERLDLIGNTVNQTTERLALQSKSINDTNTGLEECVITTNVINTTVNQVQSRLEAQQASMNMSISSMLIDIEALKSINISNETMIILKERLDLIETTVNKTIDTLTSQSKSLNDTQIDIQEHMTKIINLNVTVNQQELWLEQMEAQQASLNISVSSMLMDIETLNSFNITNQTLLTLEDSICTVEERLDLVETIVNKTTDTLNSQSTSLNATKLDLQAHMTNIITLNNTFNQQELRLEQLEAHQASLNISVSSILIDIEILKTFNITTNEVLLTLEDSICTVEERLDVVEINVNQTTDILESQSKSINDTKADLQDQVMQINTLNNTVIRLDLLLSQLEAQGTSLNSSVTSMLTDVQALNTGNFKILPNCTRMSDCLHTGKCIRRFGGIYAYCQNFIDRK